MVDLTTPEQRKLALAFYAAIRAETVQRLSMREQVLLASLTVSGVIAGFAFNGNHMGLLILVAFFSLPFAYAHARHSQLLLKISRYLEAELDPFLGQAPQPSEGDGEEILKGCRPLRVRHWDCSIAWSRARRWFLIWEALMNIAMLCCPAVAAVVYLQWRGHGISIYVYALAWGCIAIAFALMFQQFVSALRPKVELSEIRRTVD